MGEIADGLINGDFDFFTGEYIGRGGGFPRTKNKSLKWEKSKPAWYYNSGRSTKDSKELYGIKCFLYNNCFDYMTAHNANTVFNEILAKYGKSPEEIQKDWPAFKQWVLTNYPKKKK